MITAVTGSPPNRNAAWQGGVGGQSEQAQTAVAELCYPRPAAVKGAVLADLLRGDVLSHLDVWQRHGSSRAAHHVLRLRQSGWAVVSEEISAPTSDGRTARIALYSLPAETIAAAGERGQRYASECAAIEAKRRAA